MNPRWVARFARWAAAAAIILLVAVAALLVRRSRQAARALRHRPPPVPASVAQQSLGFTFSKVEGRQTVFTVRAARATEYRGQRQNLLEDVDIVVYGRRGDRHDEIHTRSCEYAPATGRVTCHGTVEMALMNVAGAAPAPGAPPDIQLQTRNVSFDGATGEVSTDAPVGFRFPGGQGSAVGITYYGREARIELEESVDLTLASDRPAAPPVHINAASLEFDRTAGRLRLAGPVQVAEGTRQLDAAELTVDLDAQLHPRRAYAAGGASPVRMTESSRSARGQSEDIRATNVEILFDARGRAAKIQGQGGVLARQTGAAEASLAADRVTVALDPAVSEPRDVQADGDVRFASNRQGRSAELRSSSLHLSLAADSRAGAPRLVHAESPANASLNWADGGEQLRMTAGRLDASFGEANAIRRLDGAQGVRVERRTTGVPPLVTSSAALEVSFAGGEWTDARESGRVRASQADKNAAADEATWLRSTGNLRLSGNARLSDPTRQTMADRIDWNQQTGKLHAAGNVRSSYVAGVNGLTTALPGAGPADAIAQMLDANPSSGEASYTGGARIWQGDEAIEADRIVLRRANTGLLAEGNVRAAFPQAHSKTGPVLWRVRAEKLTYANYSDTSRAGAEAAGSATGLAILDGGVKALSSAAEIDAQRMELTLGRDARGSAELAQAVARESVIVRQADRWGQAERGVYTAATGKFVLSGGHPSLRDASGDSVTGAELTFSIADDTILVESAEGSRTLIRHPVPK